MLTRKQKVKVQEALTKDGQTPMDWLYKQIEDELNDLNAGDLREELYEARVDGCRKASIRDAWEKIEERIRDNLSKYPDEDDAIQVLFGPTE